MMRLRSELLILMTAVVLLSLSGCRTSRLAEKQTAVRDTVVVTNSVKANVDSLSERSSDKANDSTVDKIHEVIQIGPDGKVLSHTIDHTREAYQSHTANKATDHNSTDRQTLAKTDTVHVDHTAYVTKSNPTKTVKSTPAIYKVALAFTIVVILGVLAWLTIKFNLIDKIKKIVGK